MKIKSIKIINFRQYRNVSLEFPTSDNSVTVILGNNGFGKTTFVRSFIWCLYGKSDLFKNNIMLNKEIAEEMELNECKEVKVELKINHKEYDYVIMTKQKYKKINDENVIQESKPVTTIIKTGNFNGKFNTIIIKDSLEVKSEIDSILSEDLKDYFFYDGENNKIDDVSNHKNLKNAISKITGLDILEEMRICFDKSRKRSVYTILNSQLKSDDDIGLINERANLDKVKEDKEAKIINIDETENEIEKLEQLVSEKKSQIAANKETLDKQKEMNELEDEIKDETNKASNLFQQLHDSFTGRTKRGKSTENFLRLLFAKCYSDNNLFEIEEQSSFKSENSLSNISEEAIDQLIERGFCLCNLNLKERKDIVDKLIEAKQHMEPHDYGKYLSDFINVEESNENDAQYFERNLNEEINDYLDLLKSIDTKRNRINTIKKEIIGLPNVGNIQRELDTYTMQLNNNKGRLEAYKDDVTNFNDKINKLQNKIIQLQNKKGANDLINRCLVYSDYIYQKLDDKISEKEAKIRELLQEEVNTLFGQMYHGNRDISIDSNFKVSTRVNEDETVDASTGIETVKNFAFVCGLLKLIKSNVLNNEFDDETSDETYPLVMDAPFSNTDEEHIKGIARVLPENCNQIIIVIMEKDYEYAKEVLSDKVGGMYKIVKHTETYDTIEEIDYV